MGEGGVEARRCAWCHGSEGELVELRDLAWGGITFAAHPEHEGELRRFLERARRAGPRFVSALLLALIVAIPAVALAALLHPEAGQVLVALLIGGVGGLLLAFPLATPQAVLLVGARRAVVFARATGGLLLAIGLAILAAILA